MTKYFQFPARGAFSPKTNLTMGMAFDRAWKILKDSGSHLAEPIRANSTRDALARKIIEMTLKGERDPVRLYEQALAIGASNASGVPTYRVS